MRYISWKIFKCEKCFRVFKSKQDLKNHIKHEEMQTNNKLILDVMTNTMTCNNENQCNIPMINNEWHHNENASMDLEK